MYQNDRAETGSFISSGLIFPNFTTTYFIEKATVCDWQISEIREKCVDDDVG